MVMVIKGRPKFKLQASNQLILNHSWKGAENAKAHRSRENFETSWIVFAKFFGIFLIQKVLSKKD